MPLHERTTCKQSLNVYIEMISPDLPCLSMFRLWVESKALAYFNRSANTFPSSCLSLASAHVCGKDCVYFTRNFCYIIITAYFDIEIMTETSLH